MGLAAVLVTAVTSSDIPALPVLVAIAFGVVMAIVGHTAHDNRIVAAGLIILFLATAAMVLVGMAAFDDNSNDPRPCLKGVC